VSFKLQARRSGGSPPPSRRCGDSGSSPDAPFPGRRGGLSRHRRGNRSPGLAIRLACCNWLQDLCWEGAYITSATLAPSSGLTRLSWGQRSWRPSAGMDQPSRKSRAEIPATPAAPSLAIR
jgi:hypothetical protein